MKLSDFDYDLPAELIAQYAAQRRDEARLMVLDRKTQSIRHAVFKDIVDYMRHKDLLVLNDTRVEPARLSGNRLTGGKVEALLVKRKEGTCFEALLRPARLKIAEKIIFGNGKFYGIITAKNEINFYDIDFKEIYNYGVMPLPPYIKRESQESDKYYYQTVYARNSGSIAAPTAGLHFTPELLAKIETQGVDTAYLTLHVGYSTFKPVTVDNVSEHKMSGENFYVPDEAEKLIKQAVSDKERRVFATGTTSLRALESFAAGKKEGQTDLFIYPGYEIKTADCLITNFHLPKTTLFMLACAFGGTDFIRRAYQEAVENKYRFYSYGDAMLIM